MPGASDDGGEYSPRGVISGETGLAHAGAIVHNESGNIVVAHGGLEWDLQNTQEKNTTISKENARTVFRYLEISQTDFREQNYSKFF